MENTNKIDLIEWIQKAFHVVHKTWKALILLVAFSQHGLHRPRSAELQPGL